MAAWRALAAVGLIAAVVVTGCSPDASPAPSSVSVSTEVAQPETPLDGVYRMDVAADQNLTNGVPTPQEPFSRNFAIRSACGDSGCAAAVTRLEDDDPNGIRGPQIPMDYVDDQWVMAEYATSTCGNGSSAAIFAEWQLTPQPDGSLVGTRTVASFGGASCSFLWAMPVTLTRTGDIGADVEIDDPATIEPRVTYAAAGLSGSYDVTITQTKPLARTPTTIATEAGTVCTRTANRCMSLLQNIGGNPEAVVPLLFADGLWTSSGLWPSPPCTGPDIGEQPPEQKTEMTTSLDLPQPTPAPITTVTGTRETDNEGCWPSLYTETLALKRTGD